MVRTDQGDLLALAGVPFAYGREGSGRWNESLAGQGLCADPTRTRSGGFTLQAPVSPYVTPGATSGPMLVGVDGSYVHWDNVSAAATEDARVQSFNFRACLTKSTSPTHAVPIGKPASYNASDYELHARCVHCRCTDSHPYMQLIIPRR